MLLDYQRKWLDSYAHLPLRQSVRSRRLSAVQRCIFGGATLLPSAPEPTLSKRQRRRARGKAKARR